MLNVVTHVPHNDYPESHYFAPGISVIGLDTSLAPVRMICSGLEESLPIPIDEGSFNSLRDFCDYWNLNLTGRGLHIAVPAHGPDPLGIRTWLEAMGEPLEKYDLTGYRFHIRLDFKNLGLEVHFERAYVLALYALYKHRAAWVVRDVWAKLFEAYYLLDDLRREMHRLSMAFPEPPNPDEIPF